jgi:hypothetical protein
MVPYLIPEAGTFLMDLTDMIYVLFVVLCALLAINMSSGGGGGKRSRIPVAI